MSAADSSVGVEPLARLDLHALLRLYAGVMRELRRRGAVRSSNNPVADVAELLGAEAFDLQLGTNSSASFDGVSLTGERYQIKGRRLTLENPSTQLSALRNLEQGGFDFLLAIYFDEDFSVRAAYRMTHAVVTQHAKFRPHVNGCLLSLTKGLLADPRCEDVTARVRSVPMWNHPAGE